MGLPTIWSKDPALGIMQGHGLRIGGLMHLLLSGVDPCIVMVVGRWLSSAFLLDWCKVEEILLDFSGEA
jgi:hypothetical protein